MQSHIHSVGTSRGLFLEQVRLCQEPHLTETAEPMAIGGREKKVWIPPHSLRGQMQEKGGVRQ